MKDVFGSKLERTELLPFPDLLITIHLPSQSSITAPSSQLKASSSCFYSFHIIIMGFLSAALSVLLAVSISPVMGDGLNTRAQRNGLKYFGTEVSTAVLNDAAANAIAIRNEDFGAYTAEYEMKFAYTEPSRNSFSYTLGDRIVNQALNNSSTLPLALYPSPCWLIQPEIGTVS